MSRERLVVASSQEEMNMKVKDEAKKEEINNVEANLIDLPVADEQADETKAGTASKATPKLFLFCADGEH